MGKRHNYKRIATGKKGGGIVGITKTPSAVSKWALSYNLRSHIAEQTSAMFDIHYDDRLIHTESAKERQKQDNEAGSCHRQMRHCKTLPQKILRFQKLNSLLSKLVLWDRPSLKDSWNGGCYL